MLKLVQIVLIAAGAAVAALAEAEHSVARMMMFVLGGASLLTALFRPVAPRPLTLLPWLLLAATWFVPFLPGLHGAYPPTRYLMIIALGLFWSEERWIPDRWSPTLALFLAFWILLDAIRAYALYRHLAYGFDLAHVLNLLENTRQGQFLHSDYNGATILSHHLYLTLALLVPLYDAVHTPFLPQAAQILLMGGAALTVGLAARERYGNSGGAAALFFLLLHPAFQGQILHECDPGVIGLFGTSLALLGYAKESRPVYALGLLLALLSKEHFAAGWFIAGFLFCFNGRTRRLGLGTMIVAALVTAGFVWYSRRVGADLDLGMQARLRFGPDGLTLAGVASEMTKSGKLGYWLHMLAPSGFVALVGWVWILPALPEMILNSASRFPMYQMASHYATLSLPFLAFATARGTARLIAWTERTSHRAARYVAAAAFCAALFSTIGPLSHTGAFYDVIVKAPPPENQLLRDLIARLPAGDVALRGRHRLLILVPERHPVIDLPYLDMSREMASREILIDDESGEPAPSGYVEHGRSGKTVIYRKKP